MIDIGTTIREIRRRKNITIAQLCEETDLSKGFISNVENNNTFPSICTLEKITKYLHVPVSYLLLEREQRIRIVRKHELIYEILWKYQLKVEHLTNRGPLRMIIVDMPSRTSTGAPHAHEGEECHTILIRINPHSL